MDYMDPMSSVLKKADKLDLSLSPVNIGLTSTMHNLCSHENL